MSAANQGDAIVFKKANQIPLNLHIVAKKTPFGKPSFYVLDEYYNPTTIKGFVNSTKSIGEFTHIQIQTENGAKYNVQISLSNLSLKKTLWDTLKIVDKDDRINLHIFDGNKMKIFLPWVIHKNKNKIQ